MATQRKALLKDLEDSLSSSTEQADQYDTQYKQSKKILEQLKSGTCCSLNNFSYQVHYVINKVHYLQILSSSTEF